MRSFSRSRHAASPFVVARVVERSTHSLTHSPFLSTRVVVSAATPAALESDDWTAFDEAVDAFNDDEDGPDGLLAIEKVMSLVPSLVAALESGAVDDGKTAFKFLNAYDELISALKDMGKDSEAAKDLQKNVVASMSAFLGAHKDKLAESGLLESAEDMVETATVAADTFDNKL